MDFKTKERKKKISPKIRRGASELNKFKSDSEVQVNRRRSSRLKTSLCERGLRQFF